MLGEEMTSTLTMTPPNQTTTDSHRLLGKLCGPSGNEVKRSFLFLCFCALHPLYTCIR